jgi:hypothetical protein
MDPQYLEHDSQRLQAKFEELLESRNVYYNPPASVRMNFPAIVFSRVNFTKFHANDSTYLTSPRYEVTTITEDPDDPIIGKILSLSKCSFDRHFVSDNFHHNVFTLHT